MSAHLCRARKMRVTTVWRQVAIDQIGMSPVRTLTRIPAWYCHQCAHGAHTHLIDCHGCDPHLPRPAVLHLITFTSHCNRLQLSACSSRYPRPSAFALITYTTAGLQPAEWKRAEEGGICEETDSLPGALQRLQVCPCYRKTCVEGHTTDSLHSSILSASWSWLQAASCLLDCSRLVRFCLKCS